MVKKETSREDFPIEIKKALAAKSGYMCSFPGCEQKTEGPSKESEMQTASVGVAAHIVAASQGPGARRRMQDTGADKSIIKKYENGLWLCATHAKLIDTDEVSYTVPILKRWREIAELRAHLLLTSKKTIPTSLREGRQVPLSKIQREIKDNADKTIDDLCDSVVFSCIGDVWGKDIGNAIKDLVAELALNEFEHGNASEFHLAIMRSSPCLVL